MSDVKADAKAIFVEALAREGPDELEQFLAQACGSNAALRARVEELLQAHRDAGNFLGGPGPLDQTEDHPSADGPGTVIGPYKLLEQIGEGGFGIVFMAEQIQPVRRKVALKILKPGMDTRRVVARFEAERQALALMDHPNIAHVYDGGETASGRPYFVMELVRGIPITEFADQNQLRVRGRLALFVSVCQAVQHAHQKGIIHRDLKPSNIMVTLNDGTPVVKVIDFGIAKAMGQQLTDKTLFTNFAQMIGTPLYMSPEQAQMCGLDVDTRTDIYALGVLLYELLTGTTPFDGERLKTLGYDEVRRIICEEEPAKPSTRISTLGQAAATVSAHRGSDPKRLRQLFRGELDWIVMKALEKDRNRRYESASAFAADVQRYLNDEHVLACPPSVGYRLRKLVRRHQGTVFAASLVMLVLVGGIIGTTRGMLRATDAEANALSEAKQKEAALTEAENQLFQALVQQARAGRSSNRANHRLEALTAIRKAARMRVTPELRTEAIATLALPHVRIAQEWQAWPEGSLRLAFDDAYRRFARMDQGGGIVVCRVRDGREELIARLPVQAKLPVASLSISPDGRYVAFEERLKDGSVAKVSVWKVEGPSPELLLEVPEGMCERALAFHGNSQQLAIGHADSTVSVYNLATAAHVRLAVDAPPAHLAFHPRDGRLAVACGQAVKVFDVDRARELTVLPHTGIAAHVRSVAWHPDGRRLATGCYDRKIRLWDTETASEYMPPWEAPFATGDTVAFNHAGDRLVSSDSGPTALLWDVASGRLLLILPGLHGSFSTDDQIVGYSISGNSIQSWQLAAGRELRLLRNRNAGSSGYLGYMDSPIIDASGRILAANARHWLSFFDFDKGEELASVRLPREDAACPVFFDPPAPVVPSNPGEKGKEFGGWITGGRIALLLWPARFDPARPGTLCVGPPQQLASDGPNGYSMGASASKDGRVVVLPCGRGAEVLYRDRPDWRLAVEPQPDVRQAAISPDGRWIVTCTDAPDGRSKSVQIWDARPGHAETGRRVHELPMLDGSAFAKFSPDGRWLMTTTARASHLWEVGTWRPVQRFVRVHFCFSPDSRLLAINDVLSVIRLLETDTGREVTRLTGPDSAWYQPFCFSPDGTRLVTSGPGYAGLYVWDLRLIRRQLKELDLDWEWPDFAPSEGSSSIARPLKLEVDFGDLGKPTLSRAERARRKIEQYRRALAAKPDDPAGCNSLARLYATAPQPLRDVKAALPLAERAVKLAPQNAMNANTLGVVYYRAGRYREAVEVLRANLARSEDSRLVHDLYFLAMSCKKLGETERARDYYDWAVRWLRTQPNVSTNFFSQEELAEFQAEAKAVLGIKEH